jgi:autotransporter translocation and assembly factor TamB
VDLQVRLPRSSLGFLTALVPAVRRAVGSAEADVRIQGSVGSPVLSGSLGVNLDTLRFSDPNLPPVNAFVLQVDFAGNRLRVSRCVGVVAGGNVRATGGAVFERLSNPMLDLRFQARNALVLQNDDLTVRASADLRATGPWRAGLLEGTVWMTRSRFFRNVEILPIGLPGRPAPQPPAEPLSLSFRQPPLRDWRFDLAVKTADPLLVQSNLAAGKIFADLRVGGTGLQPWMEGAVTLENLVATLPFSRLSVDAGQVFFTRQQPFVPQLNIRGSSTIREFDVSVFLSGTAYAPAAVFTSSPPLPQSEIVSLLATGMTTEELTSDPNVIAGRAAILLFQRLYQRFFRRGQPAPADENFFHRIRFDVGVTDPKTGKQATALGFPLTENFLLTGGVDVGGNFQGQIKYLLRFR